MSISKRGLIYGVGFNDADYITRTRKPNGKSETCPIYLAWKDLIARCYSAKIQDISPHYIGCTICDEWKTFSNFRRWMLGQDWWGMELDKDLLDPCNRIYSPETCVFIPKSLNSFIKTRRKVDYKYPQGVSYHECTGKFRATCSAHGSIKSLGLYSTPELASLAYRKFKSNNIKEVAQQYKSSRRLYEGLIKHAELLLE